MATNNANFSTIIATTLQNFSNTILDNVITNNTVLRYLLKPGNVKIVSGGRQFVHQVLYSTNSSFAARGSLDAITVPNTNGITASQWDIKVVSGSIFLPILDVAMNGSDKEKLLDYTNAKKMEAEVSMGEVLGDQSFNATVGANDWDSIPRIISETPSLDTDVGGIDSTSGNATWWRNYSHDTAVTAFNTGSAGVIAMDTSLNEATVGVLGPKLIVTTKSIYTLYQAGLTVNQRYSMSDMSMAGTGFKSLVYADIPFVFDDNCPAGNMYGIDTDNLRLQILAQGNMKNTPFTIKTAQLGESAFLYLFANLTCGSRRSNFVIDSITA